MCIRDSFIKTPITIPVYTVTKIKQEFDPIEILNYVNRVNKTDFMGAPIGTALMQSIRDTGIVISGTKYRQVEYVIKFKIFKWSQEEREAFAKYFDLGELTDPDIGLGTSLLAYEYIKDSEFKVLTWASKLLNHGSKYFLDANNNDPNNPDHIKRFVDKNGQPTTGNLKKDGTKLTPEDDAYYHLFRHHERADFNLLNLGPF